MVVHIYKQLVRIFVTYLIWFLQNQLTMIFWNFSLFIEGIRVLIKLFWRSVLSMLGFGFVVIVILKNAIFFLIGSFRWLSNVVVTALLIRSKLKFKCSLYECTHESFLQFWIFWNEPNNPKMLFIALTYDNPYIWTLFIIFTDYNKSNSVDVEDTLKILQIPLIAYSKLEICSKSRNTGTYENMSQIFSLHILCKHQARTRVKLNDKSWIDFTDQ